MQFTGNTANKATYQHSGDTTEWEDILISKGITTKDAVLEAKGLNPADFVKEKEILIKEVTIEEALDCLDLDYIDELDEDDEFADTNMLDKYRQQRLGELKAKAVKERFGELIEIVKDEWIREVTDDSNTCSVVVHLYNNSNVECDLLDEALTQLAHRFKYVKFLRIKGNQAIENWPECNCPTLFVYENGAMSTQIITMKQFGGTQMTPADVEWWLMGKGIITDSELDEDPRESRESKKKVNRVQLSTRSGLDSDDEDLYNSDD
jgi:hypothetical protein